jgi:hypothetical protein
VDIHYAGIHLSMCSIEEYSEEVVYDPSGTDYLFTRHRIVGKALVNGQSEVRQIAGPPISYKKKPEDTRSVGEDRLAMMPAGVPGPPLTETISVNLNLHQDGVFHSPFGEGVFGDGPPGGVYARSNESQNYYVLVPEPNPVNLTWQNIRQRLELPRQALFVFEGTARPDLGELLLQSPTSLMDHCDAMNGPKPLFCEHVAAIGESGTHIIQFGIETYVNETQLLGVNNQTGPLLSNRFVSRHVTNEDQVTVIEVEGTAYFRTDGVYGGTGAEGGSAFSPDTQRINLFLPVPFGFVRENITVEGLPGANGVRYSFSDRQQPVHFPAAPYHDATRVQAVHTQSIMTDADLIHAGAQVFHSFTDRMLNTKWLRDSSGGGGGDSNWVGAANTILNNRRRP